MDKREARLDFWRLCLQHWDPDSLEYLGILSSQLFPATNFSSLVFASIPPIVGAVIMLIPRKPVDHQPYRD